MTTRGNAAQPIRNRSEDACSGLDMVALERYRQLERLGYDARHDDAHDQGELAAAAYCILYEHTQGPGCVDDDDEPTDWVQALALKMRRTDPLDRLTVAAALLVAEIDRLRRAGGLPSNYELGGVLEVGHNERREVVVQFPWFLRWVAFSPAQAEVFAQRLRDRSRVIVEEAAREVVQTSAAAEGSDV